MKCTYTLFLYSDEEKTKLLYKQKFNKIDDIISAGWNISKSLLYKITSKNYRYNPRQLKQIRILTQRTNKQNEDKVLIFG